MTKTPWIGTSWKMNKVRAEARAFCETLAASPVAQGHAARLFVIPPYPYIAEAAGLLDGTRVRVGAQNMHWAEDGAWTGEVSARMIKDCGARLVEIGHSERREFFGETDETVALKVSQAVRHGLLALVCVGDTHAEFAAKQTSAALHRQVSAALSKVDRSARDSIVIAYEPVWSIGEKGTPAEPDFVDAQHELLKTLTADLMGDPLDIVYGGSVNSQNCVALATRPMIDGLFIGRSAWKPEGYIGIVDSVIRALA
ncbi:triose-phosphate isomerase [Lichenifustis flavocetrariae]|uniref:Triosephosphate isomerase n=1 Tax=Lichenifustis flavocetrariae TaxID=2949735 RepID=A0AA42CHB6_9HYPH|nr:triose-phosphate isomerase [Lichenifustis flavocetrariae]MCW6507099.1 triose-phosphate isomerase [Lichenifustis flavocetrariae]